MEMNDWVEKPFDYDKFMNKYEEVEARLRKSDRIRSNRKNVERIEKKIQQNNENILNNLCQLNENRLLSNKAILRQLRSLRPPCVNDIVLNAVSRHVDVESIVKQKNEALMKKLKISSLLMKTANASDTLVTLTGLENIMRLYAGWVKSDTDIGKALHDIFPSTLEKEGTEVQEEEEEKEEEEQVEEVEEKDDEEQKEN